MEFTLDFPFIRDILKQEYARARDEIRDLGVLRVDVRAAEVFRILDFVEQSFTPEEKARVYAEVRRFESRLKPFTGLSGEEVPAEFDDLGPREPNR
jgi:hypothetical protein